MIKESEHVMSDLVPFSHVSSMFSSSVFKV